MTMTGPVNVSEFQELARLALPKKYYDYFAGGSVDEQTLQDNLNAFQQIIIRPRILIDVSKIDMSTTILGYKTSAPIMVAPTAFHKLAHPDGEVATARGAAASDVIMILSFMSMCTFKEVAASSPNAVRFFQLYVYKQREISALMVQRAERNEFKAIVVTVDSPRLGRREADMRHNMIRSAPKNLEGLISTDVSTVCGITIRAVEVGVSGIIVTNHGGRQLDNGPATVMVLEEVVVAVQGRIPVIMDGGVRHGTDIFKALALGTRAVMVGRPVIYGLTARGEDGVKQVMHMLKHE